MFIVAYTFCIGGVSSLMVRERLGIVVSSLSKSEQHSVHSFSSSCSSERHFHTLSWMRVISSSTIGLLYTILDRSCYSSGNFDIFELIFYPVLFRRLRHGSLVLQLSLPSMSPAPFSSLVHMFCRIGQTYKVTPGLFVRRCLPMIYFAASVTAVSVVTTCNKR